MPTSSDLLIREDAGESGRDPLRAESGSQLTAGKRTFCRAQPIRGGEVAREAATIPGIGRGRKDSLRSEGIETALDIDDQRLMSIPGFGPETRAKLLAWRHSVEQTFVFDPSRGVDPADVATVEQAVVSDRRRLEERMQKIAILQENARVTHMRQQLRPRTEAAAQAHAQAQADLNAVA